MTDVTRATEAEAAALLREALEAFDGDEDGERLLPALWAFGASVRVGGAAAPEVEARFRAVFDAVHARRLDDPCVARWREHLARALVGPRVTGGLGYLANE